MDDDDRIVVVGIGSSLLSPSGGDARLGTVVDVLSLERLRLLVLVSGTLSSSLCRARSSALSICLSASAAAVVSVAIGPFLLLKTIKGL